MHTHTQTAAAKIAIQVGKNHSNINDQNLMCTHYQIPCKVDIVQYIAILEHESETGNNEVVIVKCALTV